MNWIKCTDRMPEKDGRYLIVSHARKVTTRQYYTHHDDTFFGKVVATHWAELPELPGLGLVT